MTEPNKIQKNQTNLSEYVSNSRSFFSYNVMENKM